MKGNTEAESTTNRVEGAQAPVIVDARGCACPLPLLKAKQALVGLPAGAHLQLLATDRGVLRDLPAFAQLAGHHIVSIEELSDEYRLLLRKGLSRSG